MPSPSPGSPAPMFHRGLTSQKHGHRMRPSSAFGGAEEQTLVDSQGGSSDIEIISRKCPSEQPLETWVFENMWDHLSLPLKLSVISLWYSDIIENYLGLFVTWLTLSIEITCVYTLCDIVTLCDIESICVCTLCLHIVSTHWKISIYHWMWWWKISAQCKKYLCSAIENISNNLWLWDRSKSPKIFVTLLTLFTGNNLWQALWRTFPCNLVSL